ncbi:OmpL47-type beta-barrel domain-containing protein [Actinophytocola sp.]|uniref:OmpL47-type beta-barrel domain-containing protein n=1 Tax=Actinophytocola sp. TaxID=1872138 RepID=UPI002ED1DAA5
MTQTDQRPFRRSLAAACAGALLLVGAPHAAATNFGTPAVAWTGGGVSAGGQYFAKSGTNLTLTVNTDGDAKCVHVAGVPLQTSPVGKAAWTIAVPTLPGSTADGSVTQQVIIGENDNGSTCKSKTAELPVSYLLDNTGPSVSPLLSPAPNGAGWNSGTVNVSWTANDGTGVGGGTTTGITTVSTDTAGQTVTGFATDALGNRGPESSVVVRRDTVKPTISGTRTPAANAAGWHNTDVTVAFTCSDALAQIKSCVAAGTTGASKTLTANGAGQSVTGTATDNADNVQTTSVSGINIDKNAPSVTTTATLPSGAPYAAGTWTNQDVAVAVDCADPLSGVDSCAGDRVVDTEGADQSVTGTGKDRAGNTASAAFGDIDIDRTAPVTGASADGVWHNTGVTVDLTAHDALSGVATTRYTVDDGPVETGTSLTIGAEGTHTLTYWSTDNAGNSEASKTVEVKIDRTPPSIGHTLSPEANGNGWHNGDVDVTFTCADGTGSGIASCGPNTTVTTEGHGQTVTGTAVDNAGNTSSVPVTVNVDKTAPTVGTSVTSAATRNDAGWYNEDVTVTYACADENGGSGVDSCSAPTVLGEGANQSATGTAVDAAGNSSQAGVHGINVDKTAPVLTGTPSATGWQSDDVVVTWTCVDAGSGVVESPAPSTVTGEGENLSASATCVDRAGNSVTATVSGIAIDRAAPNTTVTVAEPFESRWYADSAEVELSGVDSLSGVADTFYAVDGGTPVEYTGTFTFDAPGKHTLTFWSVDVAGNVEDATGNAIQLWIDDADPTITGGRSPAANDFGWHNTPVTVTFDCADTQSGVAGCTAPAVLNQEGADQQVSGSVTDGVGKGASTTVSDVDIDLTAPTLSGAPVGDSRGGWYNGDVTIDWTAADGLSGVDPTTTPEDSVLTGEGRDLGAGPFTVKDKAGNESAHAAVSGIQIDRRGPAITGRATTSPNAAGWYSGEVVVDYACADPDLADGTAGSGVASCPSSTTLRGDGASQSVTGDGATDIAGNATPGVRVGGISVDGTPPTSTSDNTCTRTNGYCTGGAADVVITATDQAGLSGVAELHYSVDGGPEQIVAAATATVRIPLDGSGEGTVRYWAVDRAGNAERPNTAALKWDNIAPTVTHTVSPVPGADGWNNTDVTVRFAATDDDRGSGVEPGSTTPDVLVQDETAGRVITGSARDVAGNAGTDSVVVKLDRTAPTIRGEVTGGAPGANGWYTRPVTVHFSCSDGLSGLPATTCPDDVTLSADGADQSVTRTITDRAGNVASVTVGGIAIDQEIPTITAVSVADRAVYDETAPAPTCSATDDVSGVDSCAVTVTTVAVGEYSFVATARDKAGNSVSKSGRYRVNLYRFGGFTQPINDPGIQPGSTTSVFKAGSTVPVKFQLRNLAGAVVAARSSAPQFLTPVKAGATTAPVNETTTTESSTVDGAFRWDPAAGQYIYNWQTKGLTAGYYYRIGVRLDDGQTFFVSVGLK